MYVEKRVCMVYRENTTAVVYRIISGSGDITLRLTPLVNYRDYHNNSQRQHMVFRTTTYSEGILIKPYNLETDINIYCSDGNFVKIDDCWFYGMDTRLCRNGGLIPSKTIISRFSSKYA
jgi:hypothetical protein